MIYLKREEHVKAARVISRLWQLSPNDQRERRDLGSVLLKLGRMGQAIDHLRAYLESGAVVPDSESIRELLDRAFARSLQMELRAGWITSIVSLLAESARVLSDRRDRDLPAAWKLACNACRFSCELVASIARRVFSSARCLLALSALSGVKALTPSSAKVIHAFSPSSGANAVTRFCQVWRASSYVACLELP